MLNSFRKFCISKFKELQIDENFIKVTKRTQIFMSDIIEHYQP